MTGRDGSSSERARRFTAEDVAPNAAGWELRREQPRESLRRAAEEGFAGLLVPTSLGGSGASHVEAAQVFEELSRGCMAFAFSLVVQNNLAAGVAASPNRALAERWLPSLMSAGAIGAFCLTESDVAGSDAAAIRTRAMGVEGGWELSGAKGWVTNSATADAFSIYAQTDPQLGWRGIGGWLVVRDAPGVAVEEPYALMGAHAMGTGGIALDRCRVGDDDLLAPPGEGFKAAMAGIDRGRAWLAAMCCGILWEALSVAVAYASERLSFGRPTLELQAVRFPLVDALTDLQAARLLSGRAAEALDEGAADARLHAAHAKKFASVVAVRGILACMQAMGAAGYRAEYPLSRHLAAAKMAEYLDGTTEIQRLVIGRTLADSVGEPVHPPPARVTR